jgi:hypothetical protein
MSDIDARWLIARFGVRRPTTSPKDGKRESCRRAEAVNSIFGRSGDTISFPNPYAEQN